MATEINDGCIKFSKNSWHVKVVDYVFPDAFWGRLNLCPYLRMVVAATFSYPFMLVWNRFPHRLRKHAGLFQMEFVFFFMVVGVAFLFDIVDSTQETQQLPPFLEMVVIGFFGGNAVGIVGGLILFGIWRLVDYLKGRPKNQNSTIGLVKAYMHAKHSKICPCLEFVDN